MATTCSDLLLLSLRIWCIFEIYVCAELNLALQLFSPDGETWQESTQDTNRGCFSGVSGLVGVGGKLGT